MACFSGVLREESTSKWPNGSFAATCSCNYWCQQFFLGFRQQGSPPRLASCHRCIEPCPIHAPEASNSSFFDDVLHSVSASGSLLLAAPFEIGGTHLLQAPCCMRIRRESTALPSHTAYDLLTFKPQFAVEIRDAPPPKSHGASF